MHKRIPRRRFLEISAAGAAAAAVGLNKTPVSAAPEVTTAIAVNGTDSGRTFYGIGGISGGGGTSRLLFDYPAAQQSAILDYLFKPNYGAGLHILKCEIGGDTNSTNGAEASHMRSATDLNYSRGYEWWLMTQAHTRNPNMKFYGLEWGAPGWFVADIAPGAPFWSNNNITYIINWIKGAQSTYGLTINYIGGWNESSYNIAWYEALKAALQKNGLSTQVVASDDATWAVATDILGNSSFASAVDIIGCHYPPSLTSTASALSTGKPLWASENGSGQYNSGAAGIARSLNQDYINGKIAANINWSLVASWYPTLPFSGDGLLLAQQPWSGNYVVGLSIWAMAHTGQFTQPGWLYLDGACGFLGSNGSYVTLKSTNGTDYSVIIETTQATAAQTATFTVSGGLSTGTVHVWATNMTSSSTSTWFIQQASITPSNGTYSLTLQPGFLYSLTTTTGQAKGTATPPASAALALPFTQNFDGLAVGKLAPYFSDLMGAFETATAGGGRSGTIYRQVITTAPIAWHSGSPIPPLTIVGDPGWSNYRISVDVLLEQAGFVEVIGNLASQIRLAGAEQGYHFQITNTGAWKLYLETATSTVKTDTTLASGTTTAPGLNTWHTISLTLSAGTITAVYNGTTLATITDLTYTGGQVGLLVSKWINAQFDNFSVTSTGVPSGFNPSFKYKVINVNSGLALEIPGSSTTQGTTIDQNTYTGASNQLWNIVLVSGNIYTIVNVNSGLVLDDLNKAVALQSPVGQWAATGGVNQEWTFNVVSGNIYAIENVNSGLVLDVNAKSKTAGATVDQYTSNGGTNQQWTISAVS